MSAWRVLSVRSIGTFLLLIGFVFQPLGGAAIPVQAQAGAAAPLVISPIAVAVSPRLSSLAPAQPGTSAALVQQIPLRMPDKSNSVNSLSVPLASDPVLQSATPSSQMPAAAQNFEGLSNVSNVLPPDPNGDVGYDPATGKKYNVQWVNLVYAVWDVTGTPHQILGPISGKQIWSGMNNTCSNSGEGDPVVLFDSLASRWILSQFAFQIDSLGNPINPPFYQCIAVSETADPTGAYYQYAFAYPNNKFGDYPKFGVWPDAYYMTANQFSNNTWAGAGVAAFERARMLAGDPSARMVYFDLQNTNTNFGNMLPADLDGWNPPSAGSPDIFAEVDSGTNLPPSDGLRLWNFHVDWTNTANSTFGKSLQPDQFLPVSAFNMLPCYAGRQTTRSCIPQPGTSSRLDGVADRLMFRLAYRNLGNHQALVLNHTVWADGTDRAGIRWYELRSTGSSWSIFQQSTFAPTDGQNRWMGSAAMDSAGDIALGYSLAGPSTYPSIAYAGRLAGDPLGQLAQSENLVIAGSGSQTNSTGRWGDYSMLTVDPQDDCTFWYTQEYIRLTSNIGWQTRIASFKFPNCNNAGGFTVSGTVTDNTPGGHTWPLYARLDVTSGSTTSTIFTDPISGGFQVSVNPTASLTLKVSAVAGGYTQKTITLAPPISTPLSIQLTADTNVCQAPGYALQGGTCTSQSGGLIVGSVQDNNTQSGINGATVSIGSPAASQVTTFATPDDPVQPDGFFIAFSASGSQSLTATASTGYQAQTKKVSVLANQVVRLDFVLSAGQLQVTPGAIAAQVDPGKSRVASINIKNTGSLPVNFSMTMNMPGPAWLSLTPISGSLAAGASTVVKVTLASAGMAIRDYGTTLHVSNDTPYGSLDLPVNLRVGQAMYLPMISK